MKFQNLVVTLCGLLYGLSSLAAVSSPKTTVYPSSLFPGKMWVAPTANSSVTSTSIWHEQESHDVRYRSLDETTAPTDRRRAEYSEYCLPPETEPMPKYRGAQEEMPRYRSEVDEDFEPQLRERPRSRRPPPEDSPPPRYRYNLEMPYYRSFQNLPPVWDWMDDPAFSDLNPPVNPYDWGSPYMRNHFSATEPRTDQSSSVLPVPLKNQPVLQNSTLPPVTISADWIPAPSSALVDSDEFHPNYVTRPPSAITLGEIQP